VAEAGASTTNGQTNFNDRFACDLQSWEMRVNLGPCKGLDATSDTVVPGAAPAPIPRTRRRTRGRP